MMFAFLMLGEWLLNIDPAIPAPLGLKPLPGKGCGNRRLWGRVQICFLVLAFLLPADPALARIRTLQLPELIDQSDIIVIGRVGEIVKKAEVPKGNGISEETLEVVVLPVTILKGKWQKAKPMKFLSHRSVRNGRQVWREDEISFPKKGSSVVLFLRRDNRGNLKIVNGIQGLWPLGKDGKPLGMGFGYSVDELKNEIYKANRNKTIRNR